MQQISPLIENRADPYIYKHTDGYYYFTASVPEFDRIVLRRAHTIEALATAKEVEIWHKPDSGSMSHYIWAPEIHFIDNAWIIYFAAKATETLDHTGDAHKIYILECTEENPLESIWLEKGQLKTDWESFSLDATTFEHQGIRYLVWAQMADSKESNSNIYIARMKNAFELDSSQVLLTKPELPWECIGYKVNEGPAVIHIKGKLYLTYSASATDANYCMGMLIAEDSSDLLNPSSWKKLEQPFRVSDESLGEYGPGHNSFTLGEDGATPLLVYHARNYKEIIGDPLYDGNRHTYVTKFIV